MMNRMLGRAAGSAPWAGRCEKHAPATAMARQTRRVRVGHMIATHQGGTDGAGIVVERETGVKSPSSNGHVPRRVVETREAPAHRPHPCSRVRGVDRRKSLKHRLEPERSWPWPQLASSIT